MKLPFSYPRSIPLGRNAWQHGFTLLEALLSVVIIGILTGVTVPVYETFVRRNDLDLATQQTVAALRRAQTYARGAKSDETWSIAFQSNAITLFQGTNFGTRDTSFDEVIALPPTISRGGLTEVQFAEFTALPNTTGNITLTSNTNDVRTITVNAKGTISY